MEVLDFQYLFLDEIDSFQHSSVQYTLNGLFQLTSVTLIYVSQAKNLRLNYNCPRTVFVQLTVRLLSIHPFVAEVIMHLFLYFFLIFSTSCFPPLNTMKSTSLVSLPFATNPAVTRRFSCQVVFILTVFSQQHLLLCMILYPPKQVFH